MSAKTATTFGMAYRSAVASAPAAAFTPLGVAAVGFCWRKRNWSDIQLVGTQVLDPTLAKSEASDG